MRRINDLSFTIDDKIVVLIENQSTINENQNIPLELIVQVYNINQGRNPEIMKRSENLNGYSIFMMKIKDYNEYLPLDESVKSAVKYCIEHDVLKDFLEKLGSEVINMLFYDFSVEEIAEIRGDERYEEGQEQGHNYEKLIIAKNLLAEGSTPEFIQKITGLDQEIIKSL